jgi:hypothetical protein
MAIDYQVIEQTGHVVNAPMGTNPYQKVFFTGNRAGFGTAYLTIEAYTNYTVDDINAGNIQQARILINGTSLPGGGIPPTYRNDSMFNPYGGAVTNFPFSNSILSPPAFFGIGFNTLEIVLHGDLTQYNNLVNVWFIVCHYVVA